ncbi:hypothetical protein C5167_040925 [Papaver somniferum]|uniref:MATH domain-containing protein n=1 Tax=Papaver somniferum TaxID=3469 RepID=A0A4Y7IJQ0_PAPSO|nr:hypothetical protein C5167_040925 [Papaver somniferum]
MVGQLVQVSSKFVWTIENFSELTDKVVQYSDVFTADGYEWKLAIHPLGVGKVYDYLSIFLCPVNDSTSDLYVKFSLSITSQSNGSNRVIRETDTNSLPRKCGLDWGWIKFLHLSELYDPDEGYIVNDTCIIEVEVSCGMED